MDHGYVLHCSTHPSKQYLDVHTNTGSPPTVQKISVSGIWKRSLHAAADAHETLLKLRNDAGAVKEQVVDAAAHISLLKSAGMKKTHTLQYLLRHMF